MGFDASEFNQVKLRLMRLTNVFDASNPQIDAMLKGMAVQVQETARNMAPIEYGDLRSAIQIRRLGVQGAGGRFMKGMNSYEVYINNNHAVSDEKAKHISSVGEYAWYVHEHMEVGRGGSGFRPSVDSMEASAAAGEIAGGRFLDRALERHADFMHTSFSRLISKTLEAAWN